MSLILTYFCCSYKPVCCQAGLNQRLFYAIICVMNIMKQLSLHPRLVAVLDVFLNFVFLWQLSAAKVWWWLLIFSLLRLIIWLLAIRFSYYPVESMRWRHFLSLFIFTSGIVLFLLFIEQGSGRYFLISNWNLIAFVYIVVVFLSFWFLPSSKMSLSIFLKPHLRWRFVMCVTGLSGIFTGIMAMISFRITYQISDWLWYVLAVLVATAIAGWWWWEYNLKYSSRFLLSLIVFFILIFELVWIVAKLPFGHLVGGLVLVWGWYLAWLLMRFNLTDEGIKWKKQTKFLGINLLLFLIFLLFVARWK